MVSITLEGLWMISDRIVDFQFFVKFHRSGPAIILVSDRIVNFQFFVKFHRSGPAIIFSFELSRNMLVMDQKSS